MFIYCCLVTAESSFLPIPNRRPWLGRLAGPERIEEWVPPLQ